MKGREQDKDQGKEQDRKQQEQIPGGPGDPRASIEEKNKCILLHLNTIIQICQPLNRRLNKKAGERKNICQLAGRSKDLKSLYPPPPPTFLKIIFIEFFLLELLSSHVKLFRVLEGVMVVKGVY